MNKVLIMYVLNACDKLVCQQEHSLEREATRTEVEEIFQRRAQQFHHHYIVVPLRAAPFYCRDAN